MKDLKLSNEKKAKMIAEQCKPCTEDFYSGIYQGVLLALDAEQKHVISVVKKTKDFLTSRTFLKKQIPKSMEHFKFITQEETSTYLDVLCEYDLEFLENRIDEYFKEFPKS